MVTLPNDFEHVAEAVAERTAALLGTDVSVVDDRGVVVASSLPWLRGSSYPQGASNADRVLRVPLTCDAGLGEVIIAESKNTQAVPPRLAQILAELVIDQAVVVDRLPNRRQLRDKFIHDLLRGDIKHEATILRESQILGMDLTQPRVVILIDASDFIGHQEVDAEISSTEAVNWRSQRVIESVVDFFELPTNTICAHIGNGEVAVLKASNPKNLGPWIQGSPDTDPVNPSWANLTALKRAGAALLARLRQDTGANINLGIGRYHAGLTGLARSYEDARAALSLGRRFLGENRVACLDELGIPAFVGVSDEQTKVDLARYLLSPLDAEPELLQTVETYFDHDCSPSATAADLSVHRNTLSYRLDKIASLTGLDPRRFDEAVQIRLALCLRSLGI